MDTLAEWLTLNKKKRARKPAATTTTTNNKNRKKSKNSSTNNHNNNRTTTTTAATKTRAGEVYHRGRVFARPAAPAAKARKEGPSKIGAGAPEKKKTLR